MQTSPLLKRNPSSSASQPLIRPAFRSPRRVTITLPFSTFQDLQAKADGEGRSLSNLAAFLLESSLRIPGEALGTAPQQGHKAAPSFR